MAADRQPNGSLGWFSLWADPMISLKIIPNIYLKPFLYDLVAKENGFISEIDLRAVGQVVIELGGGRKQQDDILDLSVGLDQISGLGQAVQSGDLLCRIHAKDEESAHSVSKNLLSAFTIDQSKLSPIPVVGELVQ